MQIAPLPNRQRLQDIDPGYFTDFNVSYLSQRISELLFGLKGDKKIKVSDRTIKAVMSNTYQVSPGRVEEMNDRVIDTVASVVRDETEMADQNSKLSAWVQQRNGDQGIVSHPKIKLNNRRPKSNYIGLRY